MHAVIGKTRMDGKKRKGVIGMMIRKERTYGIWTDEEVCV